MGGGQAGGKRHSPLVVSLLEPALLMLIKENPGHGYQMMAELGSLGFDTIHPSVIYRVLRDMEMLNWIQSDWEPDETQGPPRRVYRITDLGESVVMNWSEEFGKIQDLIHLLQTRMMKQERS